MNYSYSDIGNMPKYGRDVSMAKAIYTPALLPIDRGNPFIEALPPELSESEIRDLYYTPFPLKPTIDGTEDVQRAEIQLLREVRLPLPFIPLVEKRFHDALVLSYRARRKTLTENESTVIYEDQQTTQSGTFKAAGGADTGIGVTLLGASGCGKSETIERMLSHYPALISHRWPKSGKFLQIVWIRVVTPANANLDSLYYAIADAIDETLGNSYPVYGAELMKRRSIGRKADYVAKLIRNLGIGAIILDEIQNLDKGSNKDSSFDSLMTIINTTKVALVVIGTEDAFKLLFRKHYIARRAGEIINASDYCVDRRQFNIMMRHITAINWFREPFEPTDEILDALNKETSGVIDRMITVWSEVQTAYVMAKEKPKITPEYIHLIANDCNPFLGFMTRDVVSTYSNLGNSKLLPDTGETDVRALKHETQKETLSETLQRMTDPHLAESIFRRVKENLIENDKAYNDSTILNAVEHVIGLKSSAGCSETDLVKKALKTLSRKKSDKRPKDPAKIEEAMSSFSQMYLAAPENAV